MFAARKRQILQGDDNSPKGSWDEPIRANLDWMNRQSGLVSTSSCSGRNVLFWGTEGKGGEWLVSEHSEVTSNAIWEAAQDALETRTAEQWQGRLLTILTEPFVLHVLCEDMDVATLVLRAAHETGFKESGIMSASSSGTIAAVRTTAMRLEVPIAADHQLLVSRDFIDFIVSQCNSRFRANALRTQVFFRALRRTMALRDLTSESTGWVVVVKPEQAKTIKVALESAQWLDLAFRMAPVEDGIALPLTPAGVAGMQSADVPVGPLQELLSGAIKLRQGVELPASKVRAAKVSQYDHLRATLKAFADEYGATLSDDDMRSIPSRWERVGDCVLLPRGALQSSGMEALRSASIVANSLDVAFCKVLAARLLGVQDEVADDGFRSSGVRLLVSDGNPWVLHVDNHIKYTFDVTRCMFSSGNITEKLRVAKWNLAGEVVVDLYAGIGYWTLPILVHAKAAHVFCCEWNPASIDALRKGLVLNGVADRATVVEGDNRCGTTVERIRRVAARVILGLIPTSSDGWPAAVEALQDQGGFMHVHENVRDGEEAEHAEKCVSCFSALLAKRGGSWEVSVVHIEKVKWYAPRVRHVVIDLCCRPTVADP